MTRAHYGSRQILDRRLLAAERIVRVPRITQRLEPHRARIDHQQPSDQAFAEADDLADHFQRHHRAEDARQRAENAGFRAGRHRAGRRRLGKQAAIGRVARAVGARLVRAQRGERAVEGADRGGDQRLVGEVASVGDQIARGEIVGAVGDDVVARNQIERVRRGQPRHVGFHRHMRIEPRDGRLRAVDLAHADVAGRKDHLPLQIRQRHAVVIDHAERADAGRGEIEQHRRAEPAGADHQHARGLELGLARAADLAQHDVARIAFEFFCIEHG